MRMSPLASLSLAAVVPAIRVAATRATPARRGLGLAALAFAAGCGGGGGGGDDTTVTGTVVDARVSGGVVTVTALEPDGGVIGFLAQVTTDQQGVFSVGGQAGPMRLDVASGFYRDPATNQVVSIGSRGGSLRAYVPGPGNVAVTPLTTLAAVLVDQAVADGIPVGLAIESASEGIALAFEGPNDPTTLLPVTFDPRTTVPADLRNAALATGGITPEKLYAAVLEGLSFYASTLATPGTITAVELTRAMVLDIADGAIDGVDASSGTPVVIEVAPGVPLVPAGETFGSLLADSVIAAAASGALPGLSTTDAASIAAALGDAGAVNEAQPTIIEVDSDFEDGLGGPDQVHQLRGGDTITITGTNFQLSPAPRVFISAAGGGAIEYTVTAASTTSITATTVEDTNLLAADTGLRTVSVLNGNGLSASALQALRVVGPPASGLALELSSATVDVDTGGQVTATSTTALLDLNGFPVLAGETVTLSAIFANDATASTTATAASLAVTSTTTDATANLSFLVNVGQRTGSLAITATGLGGATSNATLTVTPGETASIALATSPAVTALVANGASAVTITGTVRDQAGNGVADGTAIDLAASTGTLSVASTTTAAVGANAQFAVTFTAPTSTAGSPAVITASTVTTGGTVSTSIAFDLLPDDALFITFTSVSPTVSSGGTGGAPGAGPVSRFVTITGNVTDANGNLRGNEPLAIVAAGPVVAASSTLTGTGLGGGLGVGEFAFQVTAADVLTAYDGSAPAVALLTVTASSGSFGTTTVAVLPGAAATVTIASPTTSTVIAGSTTVFSGTVRDASANPLLAGTEVDLSLVNAGSSFGAGSATTTTLVAGGAFSFSYTAATSTAAGDTITAVVDNADTLASASTTRALVIAPDVPDAITAFAAATTTLSTDGSSATTTTALTGTVRDQFGNPVPGAALTVLTTNANLVPQTATTTSASDGSFSFPVAAAVTFAVAPAAGGSASTTATVTEASQLVQATLAAPITIHPGRPQTITFGPANPPPATHIASSTPLTIDGQVRDTGGNFVQDGLHTVTVSSTAGTLSTTTVAVTQGAFSFTLLLTSTAVDPEVTVADAALGAIAVPAVADIDVQPAAPDAFLAFTVATTTLSVDGTLGSATTSFTGVVADEFDNPVPGATVSFSASQNLAPSSASVSAGAAGEFSFGATALTALAGAAPGQAASSTVTIVCQSVSSTTQLTINPGRPAAITFGPANPPPASRVATSTPLALDGQVKDSAGNFVLDGLHTVTVTSTGGTLSTTTIAVAQGAFAFTIVLTDAAADAEITVADAAASPLAPPLVADIDVLPAAPAAFQGFAVATTTLSIDGTNGSTTTTFSAVVVDAFANPVPAATVQLNTTANLDPVNATASTTSAGAFTFLATAKQVLSGNVAGTAASSTVTILCETVSSSTLLTINPGQPHAVAYTLFPLPPPATFAATSTAAAFAGTVKDVGGNAVLDGRVLTVTSTPAVPLSVSTTTTAGGVFNFTATFTAAQTVALTTADQTLTTVAATAFVLVVAAEPATITIDDLSLSNPVAGTTQIVFGGGVADVFGNPVLNHPVSLTIGNTAVGTLQPAAGGAALNPLLVTTAGGTASPGVYSARFVAGTSATSTTITAVASTTLASVSTSTGITVVAAPLAIIDLQNGVTNPAFTGGRLTVDDGSAGVAVGDTQVTFAGLATDIHGNPTSTPLTLAIVSGGAGGTLFVGGTATTTVTPTATGTFAFELRTVTATGVVTVRASAGAVQDTAVSADFQAGNADEIAAFATTTSTLEVSVTGDINTATLTGTVRDVFDNLVEDGTLVDFAIVAASTTASTFSPSSTVATTGGAFSVVYTAGSLAQDETITAAARLIDDLTSSATATASTTIALRANAPVLPIVLRNRTDLGATTTLAINDPPFMTADGASQITLVNESAIVDANGNIVEDGEAFNVTLGGAATGLTFPGQVTTVSGAVEILVTAGTGTGTSTIALTSARVGNGAVTTSTSVTVEAQVLDEVVASQTGTAAVLPIVLAGDVDGDGHVDIVEVDAATTTVFLSRGNGQGGLLAPSTSIVLTLGGAGTTILAAALGDADLDGDLDLVLGTDDGAEVHLFTAGAFAAAGVDAIPAAGPIAAVAIADFDRDGRPDVFGMAADTVQVALATSLVALTYGAPVVSTQFGDGDLLAFALADVTQNGFVDVVAIDGVDLFLVENDTSGDFVPAELASSEAVEATDLALGDMDGDGDLDAVLSFGGTDPRVQVRRNTGFDAAIRFLGGSIADLDIRAGVAVTSFDRVRVADLDKNGELDIVTGFTDAQATAAGAAFGRIATYRQDAAGDGAFSQDMVTTWSSIVATQASFDVADFDKDGSPDVFASFGQTNAAPSGTSVARGIVAPIVPAFPAAPSVTQNAGGVFAGATTGDFLLDGDTDVVAIEGSGDTATLNFNAGASATILSAAPVHPAAAFAALAPVDLNADGSFDLAYTDARSGQARVSLLLNDGLAGFSPPTAQQVVRGGGQTDDDQITLLAGGPFAEGAGDDLVVNVRGDVDEIRVAVSDDADDPTLTVLGTGTSTAPLGGDAGRAVAGFFDDDAHLDVAYIALDGLALPSDSVVVLFGDPLDETGNGTLLKNAPATPQITRGAGGGFNGFTDIAAGDFDADGVTDLALSFAGKVVVIRPKQSGTNFTAFTELTVGASPTALATADFDRDGKLDLAVAQTVGTGTEVVFFRGNGLGGFAPNAITKLTIATEGPATQLFATDVNRDGRPDVVVLQGTRLRVFVSQ